MRLRTYPNMKKAQYAHEKVHQDPEGSVLDGASISSKLLLSVHEAAELLGVSKRTVYLLLATGELARSKVRRRTMIHRDEVIRFAAGAGGNQKDERRAPAASKACTEDA
jgi:excisionase family DNA binding protein